MNVCMVIWHSMSITPQRSLDHSQSQSSGVEGCLTSAKQSLAQAVIQKQGSQFQTKNTMNFHSGPLEYEKKKKDITVVLHHHVQIEYPKANETNK